MPNDYYKAKPITLHFSLVHRYRTGKTFSITLVIPKIFVTIVTSEEPYVLPLVLSSSGVVAHEATVFYKRLAELVGHMQEKIYSVIMS